MIRWQVPSRTPQVAHERRHARRPATTSGETAITLVVERANGSTASVTRAVPVQIDTTTETTAPEQGVTTTTGAGGSLCRNRPPVLP
jgi:hypothetical protein